MAFGSKAMQPVVATVRLPGSSQRLRRKVMTFAAASPASARYTVGVVPAWFCSPSMVMRCHEMP